METDSPAPPDTDPVLWDRAAQGDNAAFEELYQRHAEAVWNHAYRLTGTWSQAEDLTSSTFLTAWRKRGEVRLIRDSALPWLYAVAGNLARTEFRSKGRFQRALSRVPVGDVAADHADEVAGRVDNDRHMGVVRAAIATLPKAEREIVELCLLGDLSTADAAALLGLAEPSIRSRLSRAKSRLRTSLEANR
jgi:RNA polymerase sigma factor (sigma-70 family)